MSVNRNLDKIFLGLASTYAQESSGCTKVQVGAVITKDGPAGSRVISMGANRTFPNLCKTSGCLRVAKYGDNSKNHRNPDDCRAIHSEIDAIAKSHEDLVGATIYITRYPCEACARAIVASGIKRVVYGREQKTSFDTDWIFLSAGIQVIHADYWKEDDVTV